VKITWKITKKRGNWRPVLDYQCVKEDWELELRVPGGQVEAACVPEIGWGEYRSPLPAEQLAIGEQSNSQRLLKLPMPTEKNITYECIRLPWRPGAKPQYPEVEAAMKELMAEWERRVLEALDSAALDLTGEVEHSPEYKSKVAPYVAAQRMLNQ
jgi:hypothetical protein